MTARGRRPAWPIVALAALLLGGVAADAQDQPAAQPPAAESKPADSKPADTKPAEPKPAEAKPRNIQPIERGEAINLLGRKVTGPAGENFGRVVDVLVDAERRPRAAIIDFGGFLGVGSRKIAVDWQLIEVHPDNRAAPVTLNVSRAEVQDAPEYKPSAEPAEVVVPPASGSGTPDAGK